MRYKTKEIGDEGLEVRVPITAAWLAEQCPDLEAQLDPGGAALEGRLERSGDSYLLRGTLTGALTAPCSRCLESAAVPLGVPVIVSYVERDEESTDDPQAEEDEGDVLSFSGGVIDLTSEVRDEILLAMPIGPLCRPDCKGICSVCGGNRNGADCDCEERARRAASKFSALKDLKV